MRRTFDERMKFLMSKSVDTLYAPEQDKSHLFRILKEVQQFVEPLFYFIFSGMFNYKSVWLNNYCIFELTVFSILRQFFQCFCRFLEPTWCSCIQWHTHRCHIIRIISSVCRNIVKNILLCRGFFV